MKAATLSTTTAQRQKQARGWTVPCRRPMFVILKVFYPRESYPALLHPLPWYRDRLREGQRRRRLFLRHRPLQREQRQSVRIIRRTRNNGSCGKNVLKEDRGGNFVACQLHNGWGFFGSVKIFYVGGFERLCFPFYQ